MDNALRTALLSILRPLVRYLIGRGWTYPVLTDLLKAVYLEEAVRHYSDDAGPDGMTDSRASLLTGLHRKDVKRLRAGIDAPWIVCPAAFPRGSMPAAILRSASNKSLPVNL